MSTLELRLPPPVVAALIAATMWCFAHFMTSGPRPAYRVGVAIVLAVLGAASSLSGVIAFRSARTTTNPLQPQAASTLVVAGPYRITRNPMYLGLTLILLAWATFLGSAWALLAVPAFMLYIARWQIVPEERALGTLFGEEYRAYARRVRRWL